MKDEGAEFFESDYDEVGWKQYSNNFNSIDIPDELKKILPEDVIKPLIFILGRECTYKWIHMKINSIDNRTPIELSNTINGLKALKAFIMRMPN